MMSPEVMGKRILLYFDWFFSSGWFFNPEDSEPKTPENSLHLSGWREPSPKLRVVVFLIPEEGWSVCHHLRIDISNIFAQPKSSMRICQKPPRNQSYTTQLLFSSYPSIFLTTVLSARTDSTRKETFVITQN